MDTEHLARRLLRANLAPREADIAQALRDMLKLDPNEWPEASLLAHTQRGLDQAIFHGMQTDQDILAFLTFRHLYGERFTEFPAVKRFLARTDLPAAPRMQYMMLELPMAIWHVVQRRTPAGPSTETLD
jgi:hypothetical protein